MWALGEPLRKGRYLALCVRTGTAQGRLDPFASGRGTPAPCALRPSIATNLNGSNGSDGRGSKRKRRQLGRDALIAGAPYRLAQKSIIPVVEGRFGQASAWAVESTWSSWRPAGKSASSLK
jgi:hypothetical protein